jgi:hypothetical protein
VLDENVIVAAVNDDVVTIRDVMTLWRLGNRRVADPDRSTTPKVEVQLRLAKELVMDRLWLAKGRAHPYYAELVKPRMIEDEAKDMFGALWNDGSVPPDEHDLMRFKGEVRIAMQFTLQQDPEFRRAGDVRPDDMRRDYERLPQWRRRPTTVQLGKVALGRELYGDKLDALVKQLLARAAELKSLESAAKELAPGSFVAMPECNVEQNEGLKEDILSFARKAAVGELSPPVSGTASVMLFTVLSRNEGRDVSFEEAAPLVKEWRERMRKEDRFEKFFVLKILPEAFFKPDDLFDDEIGSVIPDYKEQQQRARAAASAQAKSPATAEPAKK